MKYDNAGAPRVVYLVNHVHYDPGLDGGRDDKLIGVFADKALALSAISKATTLPGFADHPDGFSVEKFVVGEIAFQPSRG